MLELLTRSGAVIHAPEVTPLVNQATELLGGLVTLTESDSHDETVLQIMEQAAIGTTLTDSLGVVYTLYPEGWAAEAVTGEPGSILVPPYEDIVSATMPGGWSWSL